MSRIAGSWGEQASIGIKVGAVLQTPKDAPLPGSPNTPSNVTRRALPGMVSSQRSVNNPPAVNTSRGNVGARIRPRSSSQGQEISRPSAMDLADAMDLPKPSSPPKFKSALEEAGVPFGSSKVEQQIKAQIVPSSATPSYGKPEEDLSTEFISTSAPSALTPPPVWKKSSSSNFVPSPVEKRRSVFERFPPALPPLVEVNTPPPSLSKATGDVTQKQLLRESSDISRQVIEEAIPSPPTATKKHKVSVENVTNAEPKRSGMSRIYGGLPLLTQPSGTAADDTKN